MRDTDLERRVLELVQAENYRPVKPRLIAQQLGLPESARPDVRKAVKRLVRQGRLVYGGNHLVLPSGPSPGNAPGGGEAVGIFRRTSQGFGFVVVRGVDGGVRSPDIYIPAQRTSDASSGDLVRVRLRGGRPRAEEQEVRGEIVEILERDTHQFVGTYRPQSGFPLVQVDGKLFAQPIPVGDPGAKNVQPEDKVVIEMIRFPSPTHEGEAVIIEVLGPRGMPGVDTLLVVREYGLPDEFPDDVLDAARQQAERFDPLDFQDRVDLTAMTVITIDPADARDFDDAISLERLENGHWRLGVHIADVAHFVPAKSPLDREARERGTSVYLPDRVIPMLPEIISNHLASLQPHRNRFAKTVLLELADDGVPIHTEIVRSVIKSAHRFNYDEVQQYLGNPADWQDRLAPEVHRLLAWMHELAMVLRRRRLEHGSLELILPEIKLELDEQGGVSGARLVEHNESHQIIEEFMLAANEAVARHLSDQQLLFLRRIHAPPSPLRLRDLTTFVRQLGLQCESLESRFEIKRVLQQVAGQPLEPAVNYAVLRSMQKAVYGPEEERHYALNKTHYCHFTSPIRRYPDLTVHRLLDQLARGKRPRNDLNEWMLLGEHCSQREQRAADAERELIKIKLLHYLSERIGLVMDGVVTGVENYGLFVQGVELPADGLIHVSSLVDDYYYHDPTAHSLIGRRSGRQYRLGDVVKVEVLRVDVERRELDFRLIAPPGSAIPPSPRQAKPGRKTAPRPRATGRPKRRGRRLP